MERREEAQAPNSGAWEQLISRASCCYLSLLESRRELMRETS